MVEVVRWHVSHRNLVVVAVGVVVLLLMLTVFVAATAVLKVSYERFLCLFE